MKLQPNAGNHLKYGFTIIELMAVIAIVALLVTAVLPGYQNFVRNNQAFIMASRLESSLRLAQAEAIKRGIPVTVCPISESINLATSFSNSTEEYHCLDTTTWNALKVFTDPGMNATEDFSDGWPIIKYFGDVQPGTITSNISGPITFDPMGFANINPSATRSGWTWSNSYTSGEWQWRYSYGTAYTGSYERIFMITPTGCTGQNARLVTITQNGVITIVNTNC